MESVYIETTIVSYLVARPSRDLLVAAHQQITQDWWIERSREFECYISQIVIEEASVGDQEQAKKRIDTMKALSVLEVTKAAENLTRVILANGVREFVKNKLPSQRINNDIPFRQ